MDPPEPEATSCKGLQAEHLRNISERKKAQDAITVTRPFLRHCKYADPAFDTPHRSQSPDSRSVDLCHPELKDLGDAGSAADA